MKNPFRLAAFLSCLFPAFVPTGRAEVSWTAVPMRLDHNRLLIDAEIQQADGRWYPARLWVDTGNPDFMINAASAQALGFDVPTEFSATGSTAPVELNPPKGVRIGGMPIDFTGTRPTMRMGARQWDTMHADANLPSTVLKRYRVIFDYPQVQLTLAAPGAIAPRGVRAAAHVHPETGIVQIEVVINVLDRLAAAVDRRSPDYQMAIKVSSGFGGGMSLGSVCGAVTGGIMAIGLKYGGAESPSNADVKKRVLEFANRFKAQHRFINCPELTGVDVSNPEIRCLAVWLACQRAAKRRGTLSADRIAASHSTKASRTR